MKLQKRKSGGQALVMVTLALFAMAGMMGLAIDLGWSFFVQKQAQAAVDGAALAAVHEGYERLGGSVSSVNCGTGVYCETSASPTSCGGLGGGTASNLYNGCLYAVNNGFDYANNGKVSVTVQANVGSAALPTTPTGADLNITHIAYWATYRASQSIPQLFSSVLGNTNGTVTAIGTAAIVAQVIPGSFYGLDRVGDCLADGAGGALTTSSQLNNCGVDINVQGSGGTCQSSPGVNVTGVSAVICAPNGVVLASSCNHGATSSPAGCDDPGGSATQNYAGNANNPNTQIWSGTTVRIAGDGTVDRPNNFIPTPTNGASQSATSDPFEGKLQPPIMPNTATCDLTVTTNNYTGISGGTAASPLILGPYQYTVTVKSNNGSTTTYGNPLAVNSGYVQFAKTGVCDSKLVGGSITAATAGGGSPPTGTTPSYIFWGGLGTSSNNAHVDFTDGQYVIAGTSTTTNDSSKVASGYSLNFNGGDVTCSTCSGGSSGGLMFITTDDTYTGTLTKPSSLPTLYQGGVSMKNTTINISGITDQADAALADYQNILVWQDRRNSTVQYDSTGHVIADSYDSNIASVWAANHVTSVSPEYLSDNGNNSSHITGVIHQPRGAWFNFQPGNASSDSALQIFTGAFITRTNGGSISGGGTSMTLLPLTKPTIVYRTSLIQ